MVLGNNGAHVDPLPMVEQVAAVADAAAIRIGEALGGGQVDDDIIREFPVVEGEPLGNGEAPAVRDVVEESVVVVGDLGVWEGALSSVVADPPLVRRGEPPVRDLLNKYNNSAGRLPPPNLVNEKFF